MADKCDVTNYLPVTKLSAIRHSRRVCRSFEDSEEAKCIHVSLCMYRITLANLESEGVQLQNGVADNRTATGR